MWLRDATWGPDDCRCLGDPDRQTLEEAGPAAVLPSVAELPDWLVTHGYVAHQPAA